MNFSDHELATIRKDLERIRRHEEQRRANGATEKQEDANTLPPPGQAEADASRARGFSPRAFLRGLVQALHGTRGSATESSQAVPEHLVTFLQVLVEEPKFKQWLFSIESLSPLRRDQQLERLAGVLRAEGNPSSLAESFEALREPKLFTAACQWLREESAV